MRHKMFTSAVIAILAVVLVTDAQAVISGGGAARGGFSGGAFSGGGRVSSPAPSNGFSTKFTTPPSAPASKAAPAPPAAAPRTVVNNTTVVNRTYVQPAPSFMSHPGDFFMYYMMFSFLSHPQPPPVVVVTGQGAASNGAGSVAVKRDPLDDHRPLDTGQQELFGIVFLLFLVLCVAAIITLVWMSFRKKKV